MKKYIVASLIILIAFIVSRDNKVFFIYNFYNNFNLHCNKCGDVEYYDYFNRTEYVYPKNKIIPNNKVSGVKSTFYHIYKKNKKYKHNFNYYRFDKYGNTIEYKYFNYGSGLTVDNYTTQIEYNIDHQIVEMIEEHANHEYYIKENFDYNIDKKPFKRTQSISINNMLEKYNNTIYETMLYDNPFLTVNSIIDNRNNIVSSSKYLFDDNDNIIEKYKYNYFCPLNSKHKHIVPSRFGMTEEIECFPKDTTSEVRFYTYDNYSNIILYQVVDNGRLFKSFIYSHDYDNLQTKLSIVLRNKLYLKILYKFDENNLLQEEQYFKNDELVGEKIYEYEYGYDELNLLNFRTL